MLLQTALARCDMQVCLAMKAVTVREASLACCVRLERLGASACAAPHAYWGSYCTPVRTRHSKLREAPRKPGRGSPGAPERLLAAMRRWLNSALNAGQILQRGALMGERGAQDMVTGTRAGDLVKLCNEKFHPGLNAALAASGSPSLEGGGIASARAPAPARSPPAPYT